MLRAIRLNRRLVLDPFSGNIYIRTIYCILRDDISVQPAISPLKKSIRATAGPYGRNTALRSLAESQDGTRRAPCLRPQWQVFCPGNRLPKFGRRVARLARRLSEATCARSPSEGNDARRDESADEW